MSQTRKVFVAPASVHRVGGVWSQVELSDAHVPLSAIESADRPEPGEEPGYDGRMVYVRGHKYEITDDIAEALADIKVLVRTTTDGRRVVSSSVITYETRNYLPERRERVVSPAGPAFTPRQQAEIERLMNARMAELGLQEAKT